MALLQTPAPDFTDPLGLLAACHQRMLGHCELLERMLAWLPAHGADGEIRAAADRVVRYFETAAPHHHADEEQDLFPLLAGDPGLAAVIGALEREHTQLEAAWAALAPGLRRLVAGQVPAGLESSIGDFVSAYRRHIGTENTLVLPRAGELLDRSRLAALGRAMARRRGVTSTASD